MTTDRSTADESDAEYEDDQHDNDRAERSIMRHLPVIRSASALDVALADSDESSYWEDDPICRASYRADIETNGPVMRMEFSKFNNWYPIDSSFEGKFLERVSAGAFVKTINERGGQVKVLFNHGKDAQIGEKILGPVSLLEERSEGTYSEVPLLDTTYNRDLVAGLRAGVYGSSFMFHVMDDKWEYAPERSAHNPEGVPERTVTAVRLLEFGPCTWPANPQASAGMRSDTDWYYADLRSQDPELYNSIEDGFAEFRSGNFLTGTSDDEAIPYDENSPEWDTSEDEAAEPTSAPEKIHANGYSPDERAAVLRGLELQELM